VYSSAVRGRLEIPRQQRRTWPPCKQRSVSANLRLKLDNFQIPRCGCGVQHCALSVFRIDICILLDQPLDNCPLSIVSSTMQDCVAVTVCCVDICILHPSIERLASVRGYIFGCNCLVSGMALMWWKVTRPRHMRNDHVVIWVCGMLSPAGPPVSAGPRTNIFIHSAARV